MTLTCTILLMAVFSDYCTEKVRVIINLSFSPPPSGLHSGPRSPVRCKRNSGTPVVRKCTRNGSNGTAGRKNAREPPRLIAPAPVSPPAPLCGDNPNGSHTTRMSWRGWPRACILSMHTRHRQPLFRSAPLGAPLRSRSRVCSSITSSLMTHIQSSASNPMMSAGKGLAPLPAPAAETVVSPSSTLSEGRR
jgi:hypothetical protein